MEASKTIVMCHTVSLISVLEKGGLFFYINIELMACTNNKNLNK